MIITMESKANGGSVNETRTESGGTSGQSYTAREKSKRPQLSCNACRARKCDRVQPCTACSLHQIAELCHYDLTDAERQPILQAEALREKDKEIALLRLELIALGGGTPQTSKGPANDTDSRKKRKPVPSGKGGRKPVTIRQKKSARHEENEIICSSSPPLTEVIKEIADLTIRSKAASLSYSSLGGSDSLNSVDLFSHPFPTFWATKDNIAALVSLVPRKDELLFYIESFHCRVQGCTFPQFSEECSKSTLGHFLNDLEHHATIQPERLALLFVILAHGIQRGPKKRRGDRGIAEIEEGVSNQEEIFIAAAFQALRVAAFMTRPNLVILETLIMIAPFLTDSGKIEDSWALFGLIVRLAQALDLHRDPTQLDPQPSARDILVRKNIWWWMLYIDQQYSVSLGRPLGISSLGGYSAPKATQSQTLFQNLSQYHGPFTILARQILSAGQLCDAQIDNFTEQVIFLQSSLPEAVQFDRSWLSQRTAVPEWPLNLQAACLHLESHNIIVLLNRQRAERNTSRNKREGIGLATDEGRQGAHLQDLARFILLGSCREILWVFEFFHSRLRAGMTSWTACQQALNAANILIISMFDVGDSQDYPLVYQAYETFLEIDALGIHRLAGPAAQKLQSLIGRIQSTGEVTQKSVGKQFAPSSQASTSQSIGYNIQLLPQIQGNDSAQICPEGNNKSRHCKAESTTEKLNKKPKAMNVSSKAQRQKASVKKSQRKDSPKQRRSSGLPVHEVWHVDLANSSSAHENHSQQRGIPSKLPCVDVKPVPAQESTGYSTSGQAAPHLPSACHTPYEVLSPAHTPPFAETMKVAPFNGHNSSADSKFWNCFHSAPAQLPHAIAPYPTGLISYSTATSLSQSYPPSLQSASHRSSTYAHSTVSSLPTPLTSHPVSPSLSQNQGYCLSQPQTQPHSPEWGFDGTNGLVGDAAAMGIGTVGDDLERDDVRWMWAPGWSA